MLPQWRSSRSEGTVLSESVYSQPTPPRASARLSALIASNLAWPLRGRGSHGDTSRSTSPAMTVVSSNTPPQLPPLRIRSQTGDSTRSPTSVRSIVDPISNPAIDTSRPQLSPLEFASSADSSPVQAPARVLDYGGNVPLDAPFETSARRFGSIHHTRNPSGRSHRSHRSHRSNRSQRSQTHRSIRRYEERSRGSEGGSRERGPRWRPKHSKGKILFPAMKHAIIRTKFFHTAVTGGLLVLMLVVFLVLLASTSSFTQEFKIIAVLFMLVFAVLFLHSLLRMLMLMRHLKKHGTLSRKSSLSSHESVVRHAQPIHVVLARDEELGIGGTPPIGAESEELPKPPPPPPPPPVYGLWRGSVRVDPNLIHWQRVEGSRPLSSGTVHRPPSYANDGESAEIQLDRQLAQEQASAARWQPMIPQAHSQRDDRAGYLV